MSGLTDASASAEGPGGRGCRGGRPERPQELVHRLSGVEPLIPENLGARPLQPTGAEDLLELFSRCYETAANRASVKATGALDTGDMGD